MSQAVMSSPLDQFEFVSPAPDSVIDSDGTQLVDIQATQSFRLAARRWLEACDAAIKCTLMLIPGIFLLSQIPVTAGVKLQMGAAGLLLIVGGIYFLTQLISIISEKIAVSSEGISATRGLRRHTIAWVDVKGWTIHEQAGDRPELATLCISPVSDADPDLVIPGNCLNERELRILRRYFEFYASGRQNTERAPQVSSH